MTDDHIKRLAEDVIEPIINILLSDIRERFLKENNENIMLFNELVFLDIKNLTEIFKNNLVENITLKTLCAINNVEREIDAISQLINLYTIFKAKKNVSTSILNNTLVRNGYVDNEHPDYNLGEGSEDYLVLHIEDYDDVDDSTDFLYAQQNVLIIDKECECLKCVLKFFNEYESLKESHSIIYKLYKYASILPTTQVKCERDFSKLKLIKNAKRNSLGRQNMENLMIISAEHDLLKRISLEEILNNVASTSKLLANYLL